MLSASSFSEKGTLAISVVFLASKLHCPRVSVKCLLHQFLNSVQIFLYLPASLHLLGVSLGNNFCQSIRSYDQTSFFSSSPFVRNGSEVLLCCWIVGGTSSFEMWSLYEILLKPTSYAAYKMCVSVFHMHTDIWTSPWHALVLFRVSCYFLSQDVVLTFGRTSAALVIMKRFFFNISVGTALLIAL